MDNILRQIYRNSEETTKALSVSAKQLQKLYALEQKSAAIDEKQRKQDEKFRKREARDAKRKGEDKKKKEATVEKQSKKKNEETKKGFMGTIGDMVKNLAGFLTGGGLIKLLGGALLAGVAGWQIWENREWLIENVWNPIKDKWDKEFIPYYEKQIKPWIDKKVIDPLMNELEYFGGVVKEKVMDWLDEQVLVPLGDWLASKGFANPMNDNKDRGATDTEGNTQTYRDAQQHTQATRNTFNETYRDDKSTPEQIAAAREAVRNAEVLEELHRQLEEAQISIRKGEELLQDSKNKEAEFAMEDSNFFNRWLIDQHRRQQRIIEEELRKVREKEKNARINILAHQNKQNIRIQQKQVGGHIDVPGSGNGDQVPMMLPQGSFVLNRNAASMFQNGGLVPTLLEPGEKVFMPGQWDSSIENLNSSMPRFQTGGVVNAFGMEGSVLETLKTEQPELYKKLKDANFDPKKLKELEGKTDGIASAVKFDANGNPIGVDGHGGMGGDGADSGNTFEQLINWAKGLAGGLGNTPFGGMAGFVGGFMKRMGEHLGISGDGIMNFFGSISQGASNLFGNISNTANNVLNGGEPNHNGQAGNDAASGAASINDPNAKAALNAIADAEGTSSYPNQGYNTHFGGGQTADLSRHPARIVSKGGYASDAFGRYQFLSTTWNGTGGGEMTPERQDAAALRLVSGRGVDLSDGLSINEIYRLGGEWASIEGGPNMRKGGGYGGQAKFSAEQFLKMYEGYGGKAQKRQKGGRVGRGGKAHSSVQPTQSGMGSIGSSVIQERHQFGGVVGSQQLRHTTQPNDMRMQENMAKFAEAVAAQIYSEPVVVFEDAPSSGGGTTVAEGVAGFRTVPSLPDGPSTSHAAQYMYKVALGNVT